MDQVSNRRRRATLLRWALNVHTYGGLLCSSYLVVYGISSIVFNHPQLRNATPREVVTWEREVAWPDFDDPMEQAVAIRDELGLFGEAMFARVDAGTLRFEVYRGLKNYGLALEQSSGVVSVQERRVRVSSVFGALHGAGASEGSRWMHVWWVFTELSWIFIVFSAASGVYLWAERGTSSLRWSAVLGAGGGFVMLSYLVMR